VIRLYLLRHGEAEFSAAHDEMRRLTDEGFRQVKRAATRLPADVDFRVYHSPYVRATESAQAVAGILGVETLHPANWLTPDQPVNETVARLAPLAIQPLLLVTHNPLVSALAAELSGESVSRVGFGTGSVAALEGDEFLPGCMAFRWL